MAFFKSNKIKYNGTTKNFAIGLPEAEGEDYSAQGDAESVFKDFLEIQQHVSEGKFIISGRKGTGKSAYVKYLMDSSGEKNELYTKKVTPKDLHLHKVINSVPEDQNRYTLLCEWVILCQFGKMLIESGLIQYKDGAKELKEFFKKNSGIVEIDKFALVEEYNEGSIGINLNPLKSGTFSVLLNRQQKASQKKPAFYSFIPTLRDIIKTVIHYDCLKDFNFVLLFDDLDLSFSLSNQEDKEHLIDLIRLARTYNTELFANSGARILLFVRDDVAKQVSGIVSDRAKMFGSYEYRLNWYNHEGRGMRETDIILRKFINRRIAKAFDKLGVEYNKHDPWLSFVDNDAMAEYGNRTAFRYILNMTFYRPRDFVNVFRNIEDTNYHIPLDVNSIRSILKNYVRINFEEIKDELSIQFNPDEIEHIIAVLKAVANHNGDVSYDEIVENLEQQGFEESMLSTLCQYNLIVPKDHYNNHYYTYREQDFDDDYEEYEYGVPNSIFLYFKPHMIAKP